MQLAGTVVSRATLHNADEIERKDVREGDVVVVEKAGKVIPHIVRVETTERKSAVRKFVFPAKCPECGTALVKDEGGVLHPLPERRVSGPTQGAAPLLCQPQRQWTSKGLGDKLVDQLVNLRLVRSYGDLYRLTLESVDAAGTHGAQVVGEPVGAVRGQPAPGAARGC